MAGIALRLLATGALAACLTVPSFSGSTVVEHGSPTQLTAHEWGTFTSVAGPDGQAVAWVPFAASPDLPGFVERFPDQGGKCSLSGTVRMETPVLYFYAPRETTVSVHVKFAKGVITEWYPHATAVKHDDAEGAIRWETVHLTPGSQAAFPGNDDNHYYAARNTSATPLHVAAPGGEQNEKFLFYRGVSAAAIPIAAQIAPEGPVIVRSLADEIPGVMLIESRGGKLGYRLSGAVRDRLQLDPPRLTATAAEVFKDLESILTARGLYADEARAMIATWRNSWFEEGSRLLYIMPPHALNAILPLSIDPAPASTARVFVGRLELITPATKKAVEQAFAAHDQLGIEKYRRFLVPILNNLIADSRSDPARQQVLHRYMNSAYAYACQTAWSSRP